MTATSPAAAGNRPGIESAPADVSQLPAGGCVGNALKLKEAPDFP